MGSYVILLAGVFLLLFSVFNIKKTINMLRKLNEKSLSVIIFSITVPIISTIIGVFFLFIFLLSLFAKNN